MVKNVDAIPTKQPPDIADNPDRGDRLQNTVEYIERLNGGGAERLTWQQLTSSFDMLTEDYPLIISPISVTSAFCRARIWQSGVRPTQLGDIGPPPLSKAQSFGRCNRPGAPFVYAGVGMSLCLSEVGAEIGDEYFVVHFRPKRTLLLLRLGAMDLYRRTEGSCDFDSATKQNIKDHLDLSRGGVWKPLLDACIADYFSRPGTDKVYKITSSMTSALIDGDPRIDGLMYESVDHKHGKCLALKSDRFGELEPFAAQMIAVDSYLGYGIFDTREIAFTDNFTDGKILWP